MIKTIQDIGDLCPAEFSPATLAYLANSLVKVAIKKADINVVDKLFLQVIDKAAKLDKVYVMVSNIEDSGTIDRGSKAYFSLAQLKVDVASLKTELAAADKKFQSSIFTVVQQIGPTSLV